MASAMCECIASVPQSATQAAHSAYTTPRVPWQRRQAQASCLSTRRPCGHTRVPRWLQAWATDIDIFITIHYNLWVDRAVPRRVVRRHVPDIPGTGALLARIVPLLGAVVYEFFFSVCGYARQCGYGFAVFAIIAIYLPSLLDGTGKTAKGRLWNAFLQSRWWTLSAKFLK